MFYGKLNILFEVKNCVEYFFYVNILTKGVIFLYLFHQFCVYNYINYLLIILSVMTKLDNNLKTQLLDLAETLNAFKSEAVQLKIAEKLLNNIFADEVPEPDQNREDHQDFAARRAKRINANKDRQNENLARERKPTGATKAMYRLLSTDFFDQPQSIAAIANRYKEEFNEIFKTSEISGILLKSVKDNLLKREKNQSNKRYEYVKTEV